MNISQRIQAKTDNGDTIIDFLIEVMKSEFDDFKLCHRLQAARLLSRYGCCHKAADAARSPLADEAISFIADNPREPSLKDSNPGSSEDTYFDTKLAQVIRESTDDGATVCRFLINVMDGELKAFTPQHRISAARELLSRGFGRNTGARASRPHRDQKPPLPAGEGWGEGENQDHQPTTSQTQQPSPHPTKSQKSPNPTNQSSDNDDWAAFIEKVTPILDEDDRRKAELAEQDPDNQPYTPDLSAFNEAWDNSEKWFEEWKNSLDPEEYQAIIDRELAEFNEMIDTKIERRKQIAAEQEQREKEEAERQAEQKEAEEKAAAEEPAEPGPPTPSQHRRKLMFVLGDSIYIDCEHPDCDLHDDDRSRWRGSVQYGAGPTRGGFP